MQDANERVAQISTATQTVARDLAVLHGAPEGITSSSSLVMNSVDQLSGLAGELRAAVEPFHLEAA